MDSARSSTDITHSRYLEYSGLMFLIGAVLYVFLAPALMDALGFKYSLDDGAIYEKVHPGTYFILLSLFFLCKDGLGNLYYLYRHHTAFVALLAFYLADFVYLISREGISGLAFMIDCHIAVPMCALIICMIPRKHCRAFVTMAILFALINSLIGIGEGFLQARLIDYNQEPVFLNEEFFRASSLIGFPLTNATFTAVVIFVVIALRIHPLLKTLVLSILFTSLVAFGGRSSLLISLLFSAMYYAVEIGRKILNRQISLRQSIIVFALVIIVPAIMAAGLSVLLNSSIGERLNAHSNLNDESANARWLAFKAFEYMKQSELWFGVSISRITEITYRMSLQYDIKWIENPWVLLMMLHGFVFFSLWLFFTVMFHYSIIKKVPTLLKLAILVFFLIASTFNSFGVKSILYPIVVSLVLSAARILESDAPDTNKTL